MLTHLWQFAWVNEYNKVQYWVYTQLRADSYTDSQAKQPVLQLSSDGKQCVYQLGLTTVNKAEVVSVVQDTPGNKSWVTVVYGCLAMSYRW